jgi:hypothetical protein
MVDEVQVGSLLTISGLTVVTGLIVEAIKRAANLGADIVSRFGPLLSMSVGIVLGLIAVFILNGADVTPETIFQAVLTGIFSGAAASGLYDAFTSGPSTSAERSDTDA